MSLLTEFFAPIKPCGYCRGRGTWWEWEGHTTTAGTTRTRYGPEGNPWHIHCEGCRGTGRTTNGARVGWRSRPHAPGFGWCYRCRTPWAFVTGHTTQYRPGSGCFPLCERCWLERSPRRRLRYYRRLLRSWQREPRAGDLPTWDDMRRAVLAEGVSHAEASW